MKRILKILIRPAVFIGIGAVAGYLYYTFIGCTSGCGITSNPVVTVIYMGLLSFLISVITKKEKG